VKGRGLRTRFILAGGLLVATTIACGLWSALTFAHLSAVIDQTLRDSREAAVLTATLASTLEREDDALLLALQGDVVKARRELDRQRRTFAETFRELQSRLLGEEQRAAAAALQQHVDAYRAAGDALLRGGPRDEAAARYHDTVNPALRQASSDCNRLRELTFQAVEQAGVRARDQARRATVIVVAISLGALVLSVVVATRLAGAVLRPVRELTASVEAVRKGQLDRRVQVRSADELGQLAEDFNRMAETLAEYRSSSLGDLLQAKMTLEATLAALPDAVIVVDPDGQIVSTNPLARDFLGAAGAQSGDQARHIDDLPLPPAVLQAVRDTLKGEPVNNRSDLSQALPGRLQGKPVKLLVAVRPIPDFLARRCGAAVVLNDVTDLARLDELRSELVAVASHELRTPLTTLRMNLLLLEEGAGNLSGRQREILAAAMLAGEELASTIEELLDLTRIEAGQLRLVQELVAVGALLEQTMRPLRSRFEDAEIALRLEDEAPGAVVPGDPARLRIVFSNLLANALKYTPPGGQVSVHVRPLPDADGREGWVRIDVTDTGPGIPAEFRERVFEKFFRVEHERDNGNEGVRGAGIGLYLCRQIIEAHHGTIWCEPAATGGTTLAVRLPILEP
jgi:NtrC-family two-component system sensor histidine kinase KinB